MTEVSFMDEPSF